MLGFDDQSGQSESGEMIKKPVVIGLCCLAACLSSTRADTTVVFNEIMYHPATNESSMEWVELYNQMAVNIDMSGWRLDGNIHYTFVNGTILRGGAFMVVAISPAALAAATGLTNILGPFTGLLANGPGHLQLRDNNNRIVNEVDYDVSGPWPVAPNGAGVSLAKLNHSTAGDQPSYWTASAQVGGTPGQENFLTPPTPVLPLAFNEISATTNTDFWVELMNYSTNTLGIGGCVISRAGATNNQYTLSPGTMIPADGFLVLSNSTLGFHPVAGDQLFLLPASQSNVLDAVVLQTGARARSPDGTGQWLNPTTLTPGGSNQFVFRGEIVINEIMYHHQLLRPTNGLAPQSSSEQWIELYNRSNNVVDLTGWSIGGGISFNFSNATTIGPGAYLVVAKDSATLRSNYPAIAIVGDFSGKLSHSGGTIILQDAAGNPANTVTYNTDGRWAHPAAGGGSSLELRDPYADNSTPGAWAASDETAKSSWQTYAYEAVAQSVIGTPEWNDLCLDLLTDGECLIDDISVIESPTSHPVQFLANGNFENGSTGWRFLGTHIQSRVEVDPSNPTNHVLHLISTGPAEHHMLNHIETTFANGHKVTDGNLYQISFRAKWLSGIPLLNTKLYFDRVAQTTLLPTPTLNGTPGARNSCYATNIGPTFTGFQHQPVVPATNQPVTVSVTAHDPQGVSLCEVWWSANGGSFSHAAMTAQANGLYTGTIPGFGSGTTVQFYVRGVDGLGAVSTYPAANSNAGALYMVADGQANLNLGHNFRICMTAANWNLMVALTNIMSSTLLPCTLIYDEQRPYYDIGVRLQGSMFGRINSPHHGYHVEFQPDDLFRGVHPVMEIKSSGRASGTNQQEAILTHHMILHAGKLPDVQDDICTAIPPFYTNTCQALLYPRFYDEFIATAYPNGDNGNDWLYELLYVPGVTNQFGYKYPTVASVTLWGTDITDLGTNKENYRYNFILKNNHTSDDFTRLIPFCQTLNLPNSPELDAQSKQVMDVDEWLRMYTMASLVGEGDWPTFGHPHNPQFYQRPDNNRMELFPWDIEQLFLITGGATAPLIGQSSSAQNWIDLESPTNISGIGFPGNTRRMYAHALDIIATTFNTTYMSNWTAHYASFCPGQDFSDMLDWIPQRTSAVLSEINGAGGNSAFAVTTPTNITTSSNLVTISGTAPVQVQMLLINGVAYPVTWTSISQWTISVPVSSPTNVLSITAYDINGNLLATYSATITVHYTGSGPNAPGTVAINEIMYNPAIPNASYLELFNNSATATFDLSNWQVNGVGYTFPPGATLGPQQMLVLVQDQSAFINAYGTALAPFDEFPGNLSTNGETLTLLITNQPTIVDEVRYSAAAPWPATTPGVSLQLVDPRQDHFRVANWAAASGTPLAPNSVATVLPSFPPLFLNELEANNLTGITNRAGQHSPWLELYNPSTNTVALKNLYLTTNYNALEGWVFPSNAVIHPGQFEVIFADGQTNLSTTNELHTGFTFGSSAGSLALSWVYNGQPQPLDYVDYTNLTFDHSFGSFPDGQVFLRREFFHPTPGTTNDGTTVGSFIAYTTPGLVYTQDFNSLPNPGPTSVNTANPVTINGITYSVSNPFDFAAPVVASGNSGGLGLPLLTGWYGLADPTASVGARFGATDGDQTTGGQISFGPPNSSNRALGLLATTTTGFTAFGARFVNQTPYTLTQINVQFTGELWRQSDKSKTLKFYYVLDPAGSIFFPTNPTAVVPFLNVSFPTNAADVGGVAVDGTSPVNQTNLTVLGQTIDNWPPGSVLWLMWEMADPGGKAQGLGIDSFSFSASPTLINTAPVLAVISNKFIYLGQTLQFAASATDTDQPPQTLTFSLDPGAPANAVISASGLFTWPATNVTVPGTNSITIRVTDSGTPPLSATQTFSVSVLPLPQLYAARLNGTNLALTFGTLPGEIYQVQSKDHLADTNWNLVGSAVPGTGANLEVDDNTTGHPERYYRLLIQP
jgi:hypothetical protein